MAAGRRRGMVLPREEVWRAVLGKESTMRQISIVLTAAVITATVAVAGVLAVLNLNHFGHVPV